METKLIKPVCNYKRELACYYIYQYVMKIVMFENRAIHY